MTQTLSRTSTSLRTSGRKPVRKSKPLKIRIEKRYYEDLKLVLTPGTDAGAVVEAINSGDAEFASGEVVHRDDGTVLARVVLPSGRYPDRIVSCHAL